MRILLSLMRLQDTQRSIEYMDNRLSLYAAQNGKCAVTGKALVLGEIHCYHKIPLKNGGNDRYNNLIIVDVDIHRLIHASNPETIEKYLAITNLTPKQLEKVNNLRKTAKLSQII